MQWIKDVVYSAAVTGLLHGRYKYVFDFTEINETGMYVIQYVIETEIFPIANDVYDVSGHAHRFLAVRMDHIEVREVIIISTVPAYG